MCLAHDWHAKSQDKMERASFRECLTSKAFARDTCKTFYFAKLSYLIHTFCTHTIYTPITHKPWELEIVIPTILYTIHCAFCSTLTSPFSYPWEVDSPNTYHTHFECQVRLWCCWEALEEAKNGRCNMVLVAGSGELDKTRFREALLK